jgi:hypothetical protein
VSSIPRIALIHATPIAMEPIHQAFGANWPAAEVINILEDSLSPDRAREAELTADLAERIVELEETAKLVMLLRGAPARRLDATDIDELKSVFGS